LTEAVLTPNLTSQTWFEHTYIVAMSKDNPACASRDQGDAIAVPEGNGLYG